MFVCARARALRELQRSTGNCTNGEAEGGASRVKVGWVLGCLLVCACREAGYLLQQLRKQSVCVFALQRHCSAFVGDSMSALFFVSARKPRASARCQPARKDRRGQSRDDFGLTKPISNWKLGRQKWKKKDIKTNGSLEALLLPISSHHCTQVKASPHDDAGSRQRTRRPLQ